MTAVAPAVLSFKLFMPHWGEKTQTHAVILPPFPALVLGYICEHYKKDAIVGVKTTSMVVLIKNSFVICSNVLIPENYD